LRLSDREARLQRAKAIGRIAYRHARDGTIVGYVEIEAFLTIGYPLAEEQWQAVINVPVSTLGGAFGLGG
jgi:hypothetical protein